MAGSKHIRLNTEPDDGVGISTDRIGARKYGYTHRAFWPAEATGRGNGTGRQLTVDSGVFNTELTASRRNAGQVFAKLRLRDSIDAIIAHDDAESPGE